MPGNSNFLLFDANLSLLQILDFNLFKLPLNFDCFRNLRGLFSNCIGANIEGCDLLIGRIETKGHALLWRIWTSRGSILKMSWLLRAALFSSVVSFCNGQSAQPKDGLNKLKYVQDVATVDCQNYIPNFTADMKKMFETGVNEKGQPSPFPKEVGLSYLAIAKKIKDKCCDVKTDGRVSTLTKCTDAEIEKIVNEEPTVEIGNPESVKDDTPAKQTCSKIVPILLAAVGMFA